MIPWFNDFYQQIVKSDLSPWLETLPTQLRQWTQQQKHGDFDKWLKLLSKLPAVSADQIELMEAVNISHTAPVSQYTQKQIEGLLRQFMPWRAWQGHEKA